MKKITKRVISIMMTMVMLFTITGVTVFADDEIYEISMEEYKTELLELRDEVEKNEDMPKEGKEDLISSIDEVLELIKEKYKSGEDLNTIFDNRIADKAAHVKERVEGELKYYGEELEIFKDYLQECKSEFSEMKNEIESSESMPENYKVFCLDSINATMKYIEECEEDINNKKGYDSYQFSNKIKSTKNNIESFLKEYNPIPDAPTGTYFDTKLEEYRTKIQEYKAELSELKEKVENNNIPQEDKESVLFEINSIMGNSIREFEAKVNRRNLEYLDFNWTLPSSVRSIKDKVEKLLGESDNQATLAPTMIPTPTTSPTSAPDTEPKSSSSTSNFTHADYSDLPKDHWAYRDVMTLTETGAFTGYEDGTFRPDNTITHEEFLSAFIRLLGIPVTPVGEDYVQVETDDMTNPQYWTNRWAAWAQPYLNAAINTTISDYGDIGFIRDYEISFMSDLGLVVFPAESNLAAVQKPITRLEVAQLLNSALKYTKEISSDSDYRINDYNAQQFTEMYKSDMYEFDGTTQISKYTTGKASYLNCAVNVVNYGIMTGYPDGTFKPEGNITRAEAAATLARLVNKDLRAECPWPPFGSGN